MDNDLMNASNPQITVVMPVYNASRYLKQAIDSILNQTYSNFIFLIINDGSTDDTEKIVLSYSDKRINYILNKENIGLTHTLNNSINLTQTKYFARMDADDIAISNRLELQFNFMETNLDIGVCGGCYETFGNKNETKHLPITDEDIKANLIFSNQLCHPSVIARTSILKNNRITFGVPFEYDDIYKHKILELEDYAIWFKLKNITKYANLDTIILKYRIEGQNLSLTKEELILERKKKFYKYILQELDIIPSDGNLLIHISSKYISQSKSANDIKKFKKHLDFILSSNKIKNIYSQVALQKVIDEKWNQLFYFLPERGFSFVLKYFIVSKSIKWNNLSYTLKYYLNIFNKKNN